VTPGNATIQERLSATVRQSPDGGLTLLNVPAMALVYRAFPAEDLEMVGQRAAMLRAALVDRFKLAAHYETREQPVYDLLMTRSDKRLGPSIKPSEADCIAKAAADRATAEATGLPPRAVFDPSAPPPVDTRRLDR
jgi:hypothetical protein